MASRRPLYLAANGSPTMIAAPDVIDPAILTPYMDLTSSQTVVSGTKTFNGGTNINGLNIGTVGYSTTTPYIGNDGSGSGGINFSVPISSTLGYRFFAATSGSAANQVAQITAAGAFNCAATISAGGAMFAAGGVFGGAATTAGAGVTAIGNDTNNSFLRVGTGGFYLQNGSGGTTWFNANATSATFAGSISATSAAFSGAISCAGLASTAVANTIGTSAANGVLSVPGTGGLYFNYFSGSSVIIGNGATGLSGTQFNTDGTATIGSNLAISGLLAVTGGATANYLRTELSTATTTGYLYFGAGTGRYCYYDGTYYQFGNASIKVNGTVYTSSRASKHSIAPIAFDSVAKVKALDIVSFKYLLGEHDANQDTHHGIIAEDTDAVFLSEDGTGLSAQSTLAIALDAIKRLTLRIEELETHDRRAA